MINLAYHLRLAIFSTLFVLLLQNASAQTGTISGYVKDANGQPLSAASIQV